jgi:hypothetical protein
MRFLKTLTLNRRAIYDSRVALDTANTFTVADSTAMVLPKSFSSLSTVQTPGMIRYNTSTNEVEVYQGVGGNTTWRSLRFKEAGQITKESYSGDGTNAVFGPLSVQPPTSLSVDGGVASTWSEDNLIVIVGGVFQIGYTNYVVELGEDITIGATALGPYTTGQYYLRFTSSSPGLSTPITVLHGFDK